MALAKITEVIGKAVPIPGDDIDTDRIIPARFMKCVTFDGLGDYAFYDVRFNEEGGKTGHPLNDPAYAEASIMLVGSNFGCGSSREHAPQALHKYGIRAIIGLTFAEIFFGNATTLGIPCISVSEKVLHTLTQEVEAQPTSEITIDVLNQKIHLNGNSYDATMAPSAHEALIEGEWDPIALLLDQPAAVDAVASKLGYA